MRAYALALVAVLALSSAAHADPPAETALEINGADQGLVFQGIGGQSSGGTSKLLHDYPEPQRGQLLDYLFKPGYGAALQHLKVEIGGDGNASNGSEASHAHHRGDRNFHRGYEWWLMKEAKRRNPDIVLSALEWGVPGWVGDGNYFSQDNIDYIIDFIKGAQREHGLTIDYVGTVNEPRVIHQVVDWNWVKRLKQAIVANRLPTKLIVGDDQRRGCCPTQLPWDDVDAMAADPELAKAVDVIGSHYAGGTVPAKAYTFGKPIWSTEDGPWTDEWNAVVGGSQQPFGQMYNVNYLDSRITATNIWNLVTGYPGNTIFPNSGLLRANEPHSAHYEIRSPVWITAHTTQFAKPGWRYLDGAAKRLAAGGSVVALRSPDGKDYSAILETQRDKDGNIPTKPQTVSVKVGGGLPANGVVRVWRTTKQEPFVRQADIPVVNGQYRITLDPDAVYTVTTTTGQAKGSAASPPAAPFPQSYRDDFESGPRGQQPKFLAQQGGSYELTPCRGRAGQCVEQVVGEQPVEWFHAYPTTYLGDDTGWTDVSVQTGIRHDLEGTAEVWARIGNNGAQSPGISMPKLPDGYYFGVEKTGRWQLGRTVNGERRRLAHGIAELPVDRWHTIRITAKGKQISAFVNGAEVARAEDETYTRGRAGIGTGWNRVQFDDLSITPA